MILGIGVDIVHLPRITALIARRGKERLARRILSPTELIEFQTRFPTLISGDQQQQQLRYLGSR
jgi:holo-[acyl-carrier protein] synthase